MVIFQGKTEVKKTRKNMIFSEKTEKTSIPWSPDKILYLAGENKTKCNRVWVRQKN